MRELSLRRHGENINPTYSAAGGGASSVGRSTDLERPDGEVSGIVKRYKKDEEASARVTAIGLIKSCSSDAIEYTGIASHVRGLILFMGLCGASLLVGFGQLFLRDILSEDSQDMFDMLQFFFASVFVVLGVYFLLSASRMELFRPEDEPVIFDRKHLKVYRLFREVHPGVKGLFQRWPIRAAEYEWDLIDAEHNAVLITTGSTAMRYHNLIFIVRKSATDPTIIDSFPVGNTVQLGELSVAPVWEHIRRFMESNGPNLPPGESINVSKPPQTLWESWVEVAPVGPKYSRTWKSMPWLMVFHHLTLPLCVPIFFFWGILNWLSYKTSIPVSWPPEVTKAVCGVRN